MCHAISMWRRVGDAGQSSAWPDGCAGTHIRVLGEIGSRGALGCKRIIRTCTT